jgi:hypothetical protein
MGKEDTGSLEISAESLSNLVQMNWWECGDGGEHWNVEGAWEVWFKRP